MGISKDELLNGYYLDEFLAVLDAHNEMNRFDAGEDKVEEVSAEDW